MIYEFKNADGRICCASNNPEHLCERCKAKAGNRARSASAAPDPEPTVAAAWPEYFSRAVDVPPDPYRAAIDARREAAGVLHVTADLDPHYRPYGMPPDIYGLAFAARRLQREVKGTAAPTPSKPQPQIAIARDANGTPDPYAAAVAARRAR